MSWGAFVCPSLLPVQQAVGACHLSPLFGRTPLSRPWAAPPVQQAVGACHFSPLFGRTPLSRPWAAPP
eukprot:356243-Chlamydomonas_euryale.AAC.9